jgi:hypothetical protein
LSGDIEMDDKLAARLLENNLLTRLLNAEGRIALLEKLSLVLNTITPTTGATLPPSFELNSFLTGLGDTNWEETDYGTVKDILNVPPYDIASNILTLLTSGNAWGAIADHDNVIHLAGFADAPARLRLYGYHDTPASGIPGITTMRGGWTDHGVWGFFPSQTKAGMVIGQWDAGGYLDKVPFPYWDVFENAINIQMIATADWTAISRPAKLVISVTPSGSTTPVPVLTINDDGSMEDGAGDPYLTAVTADAPLSGAGTGASHLSIPAATASVDGYATKEQIAKLGGISAGALAVALETAANDIFRCDLCGTSQWTGTINGAPSGAVVTYTHVSGRKNTLVPQSTSQLGKQRLYNTTRGTHALISTSNGSSTITLTANAPAGWQSGDTITTVSTTVVGGFSNGNWVDIEIVSGDMLNKLYGFLGLTCYDTTGAAGTANMFLHPFETYAGSKAFNVIHVTTTDSFMALAPIKLTSNVFSVSWVASGAATLIVVMRQQGVFA